MSGVAHQGHAAIGPGGEGRAVEQGPAEQAVGFLDQPGNDGVPAGEVSQGLLARAGFGPAFGVQSSRSTTATRLASAPPRRR